MTLQEVLVSLIHRISCGQLFATISFDEVLCWPPNALSILLNEKIIKPAPISKNVVCLGCPENCFKPVVTLPGKLDKQTRHYIACDETNHMGKVPVRPEQLQQWQISDKQLVAWLIKKLALHSITKKSTRLGELNIGLMLRDKFRCEVALNSVGILSLKVNQQLIPLADVMYVDNGQIDIDLYLIESLANQKPIPSKSEYRPSTARRDAQKLETKSMYAEWQKEYRKLKREHPNRPDTWIANKISKLEIAQGKSPGYIRKQMKK